MNLLENAAKHTSAAAAVTIRASAENGTVRCEVSDNGPGLPEGEQSAVFDKLYQLSRRGQGFGLGLPICRAIVAAHGGSIVATTAPEGGAQFIFAIPRSGGMGKEH